MPTPDLLIVGGAARAAAWCAARAGLRVAALDRFCDLDLLAVADPCVLWDGSDEQVERTVGELGVPWVYGGPLENSPDLIDRCAALAPLLGNGGDVLRAVRDPARVRAAFAAAGLPTVEVRGEQDPPPPDGSWLLKPRDSCGGHWIAVWNRTALEHPTRWGPHYYQRFLRTGGRTFSAAVPFLAAGGRARPLGGFAGGGFVGGGFRYAETWGPTPQPAGGPLSPTAPAWADAAAAAFGLTGPCGLDLAVGGPRAGRFAAVEINPRFTASMELCDPPLNPFAPPHFDEPAPPPPRWERAKRVVYADGAVRVGRLPVFGPGDVFAGGPGWVADVPAPGSAIPPGNPVCTVFAEEQLPGDAAAAAADLPARRARMRAQLDRREARARAECSPI